MAVAKASHLEPLEKSRLKVNHAALVIGGGVAGLTAALDLAAQGFPVHVVEREKELGGHLRQIRRTLDGETTDGFLKDLIETVRADGGITVHLSKSIQSISGYVGNFQDRALRRGRTS